MNPLNLYRKNFPLPKDILPRAFPGISQIEMDELVSRSQVNNYRPGTVLCQEGRIEDRFYIILDGKVNVSKTINQVEQRNLKSLQAGDFFGEMALIHDAPRAATVSAAGPVTVLEIDKDSFDRVMQRSTTISQAMVREISTRLRANDEMAIEDLKMRAAELAEAYQKLAEQELARREFLTNIAHELRTPLMAAGGFLQLMQKGMISQDKLPPTIETVWRNIQQITTLVNDILFLQEMDLILPKFQPINIVEILDEVVGSYRDKATAAKITIRMDIHKGLPQISGDPKSLERAFMSLVDNAIKFSPDGGEVLINVYEKDTYVVVDVVDHGIGISTDNIPHIFDRFFHVEKSDDKLFGGIGLGLSITNQVIKQHNGQLLVNSEPGKGSTFSIKLKAMRVMI